MDEIKITRVQASDLPVACNLSEAELALRGKEITENIFSGCEGIQELPDGYAFKFPGHDEWAVNLLKFVVDERKCCPFFTFGLLFEPGEASIWLQLRGDDRVKFFTKENFVANLCFDQD